MKTQDSTEDLHDKSGAPSWPYAPSDELPQMMLFHITDEDGRITGAWWAEAVESLDMGYSSLTHEQCKRMAQWLEDWLENKPCGFTPDGRYKVLEVVGLLRGRGLRASLKDWVSSNEWDHLL